MSETATRPELSIVLPAFDEESRLARGVQQVLDYVRDRALDAEVLVVDDGSTDRTAEILAQLATQNAELRALTHARNRGKGAAVRTGVLASRGLLVLFTDVDQSTAMSEWEQLRAAIERGHDVAIASREVAGAERITGRRYRVWMGEVFRFLRDTIVAPGFIDSQCGFKLFTRAAARTIFERARLDGFCFDVEVLTIALHKGLRVTEVPVRWTDDQRSKVSAFRDSVRMLIDLFRIRRNRKRGHYD